MRRTIPGSPMWLVIATTLLIGCDTEDERLQQVARESLKRQADQNLQMGRQSQQVAEATKLLIDAQAQGRDELIGIQKEIQAERANVAKQNERLQQEHKQLGKDRQDLAQAQHREPLIANAIQSAAMLVAAVLPLIFACYLLKSVCHEQDGEVPISELSIMDLVSESQALLRPPEPEPRKLDQQSEIPAGPSARLPAPVATFTDSRSCSAPARLFVIVEGRHDIEFLKRISRILHQHDVQLPDLERMEQDNHVIFVPTGGGDLESWTRRFAAPQVKEFHVYDREVPPLTIEREQTVAQINRRTGCKAVLTTKRAIENYLHPKAIFAASGIELEFDDESSVPELFASAKLKAGGTDIWSKLPRRGRRRTRDHAKRLLNTLAVEKMTPQLLRERDPNGDVIGWLHAVAEMLRNSPA